MSKLKIFFLMLTISMASTIGMITFSNAENSADKLGSQDEKYSGEKIICDYKLNKMKESMKPGEKKRVPIRCFQNGKPLVGELKPRHRGKLMTKKGEGLYISGKKII